MLRRYQIAVTAPEEQNDLAGWIGAEPTGEASEGTAEESGGWFDWLPGLASGVTDFISSEGGKELIKTGTELYLTREQREAQEEAQRQAEQSGLIKNIIGNRPTIPTTRPTYPTQQQPTIVIPQQKTNWVLPVAIGVGALVLLGGGFVLMKGRGKTNRRRRR